MKMTKMKSLILASTFILSSCATTAISTQTKNGLPVIILPAKQVEIVQTSARQEGNNVVVVGKIQRKISHQRATPKGHVDVAIVDQHGKILEQIPSGYTPSILPRIDGMKSSFLARIPIIVEEGSFISVKFHRGNHDI